MISGPAVNQRPCCKTTLALRTVQCVPAIAQRGPCRHLRCGRNRPLTTAAGAPTDTQATSTAVASPAAASAMVSELPIPTTSSSAEPLQATADAAPFVWTRHWWPLLPESYLPPERPTPVQLLGLSLVVWRDGGGRWRAFRDACPHRLAPLSEGRVEADGTLQCAYHGWRFQGSGACSRIPQALDGAAEAAACRSRRSCATAFPVRVEAGMLWVWPDEAPDAAATAAATPTLMSARLRERGAEYDTQARAFLASQPTHSNTSSGSSTGSDVAVGGTATVAAATPVKSAPKPIDWFFRDLPYSYEVLIENLLDPAHLPFSHHGQNPQLTRSAGKAMPMQPRKPSAAKVPDTKAGSVAAAAKAVDAPTADPAAAADPAAKVPDTSGDSQQASFPHHWPRPTGHDMEFDFVGNFSPDATVSWSAPHLITYVYRAGQTEMLTELFAVPVAPGRCRFFTMNAGMPPGVKRPPMPPLHTLGWQRAATLLMVMLDPVVMHHRFLNNILDGDGVFLHAQDEQLRMLQAEMDTAGAIPAGTSTSSTSGGKGNDTSNINDTTGSNGGSNVTGTGSSAATAAAAASSGAGVWSRLYYLPTQADNAVLAARRWLEQRAGGGPFRRLQQPQPQAPAERGAAQQQPQQQQMSPVVLTQISSPEVRARLLSRYEQHTRHCPTCSARMQQWRALAEAARAVQAAALVALCAAAGALGAAAAVQGAAAAGAATAVVGWPAAAAVMAACAAVWALAGWVARVAQNWVQMFVFVDYVHADKE